VNKSRRLRKIPFKTKGCRILVITLVLVIVAGIPATEAGGKLDKRTRLENQSVQEEKNEQELEQSDALSVWKIIKMTDWLFWPFVVITAAGIMLITYRTLLEHREKSQSQNLIQSQIKANSIRGLIQLARTSNTTRVSRLLYKMITTFYKTNRAEPIGDDINQFLATERESFETFSRINGFLSESAGALGLLGTVWGIFQTFHAGKLDGPTILQGMSISQVTTLVGLIISLILNMGGTYVFTQFNRQLNLLANKAEELRQVLLYLEKKAANKIQTVNEDYRNLRVADFRYQPGEQSRSQHSDQVAFAEM